MALHSDTVVKRRDKYGGGGGMRDFTYPLLLCLVRARAVVRFDVRHFGAHKVQLGKDDIWSEILHLFG